MLLVLPIKSNPEEPQPAAMVGKYILQEDKYWIVYNKTVQQLRDEGYDVLGDPSWLLQVNYTRLDYTMKCEIIKLSWPNVTLENIEGEHDLNVTAYRIMENGSIGEKLASFLKPDQPPRMRTWESWDPYLGVMFNTSALVIGNNFSIGLLKLSVDGTETLTDTPWGLNETYVLHGTYSFSNNTVWCDAESGIVLKEIWDTSHSTFISHEELKTVETGIEEIVGVKAGDWVAYGDSLFEWASNIPGQEEPPPETANALNISWSDIAVLDVLGSNVTFRSTVIYVNGTEQTQKSWGSIVTGEGDLSIVIIPSNLNSGDKIPASLPLFTPEPLKLFINGTVTRNYAGADREANYVNITYPLIINMTQYGSMNMSLYWDKKTGFLCEFDTHYAASFIINSTHYYLNMSVLERMTATNMWLAVLTVKNGYTFNITIASNSTISNFNFNESLKQVSFNVTGPTDKTGYCNVTIPDDLLWGEFSVYKNGSLLMKDVDYTQTHNGTHYTFYITYNHSTHTIEIISTEAVSEFPFILILPLFMIATLAVVIAFRRKHSVVKKKNHITMI